MSDSVTVQNDAEDQNRSISIKQEPTPVASSDDNINDHAEKVEETAPADVVAPPQDGSASENRADEQDSQEEITEVVTPQGDMHFVVTLTNGNHFGTFLVNSNCIRTASRTWASLLDALPDNASSLRRLEIVDDCGVMIRHALYAAHFQGRGLPTRLPFMELVHVAELCGRHDLLELFHPYIRDWAYPWLPRIFTPGYEMWILVAYEAGYYEIFRALSEHFAEYIELEYDNGNNNSIYYKFTNLSTSPLTGDILDNLIRMRLQLVQDILDTCYDMVERWSQDDIICGARTHAAPCTAMALGSLIKGLRSKDLWPLKETADHYRESAVFLTDTITSLDIPCYHDRNIGSCISINSKFSKDRYWANIRLCRSNLTTIVDGSACDKHFKDVCARVCVIPPLSWEYGATAMMGFLERDFKFATAASGVYGATGNATLVPATDGNAEDTNSQQDAPSDEDSSDSSENQSDSDASDDAEEDAEMTLLDEDNPQQDPYMDDSEMDEDYASELEPDEPAEEYLIMALDEEDR